MMKQEASQSRDKKVRIGISACVLGHEVRFNGGHKLDSYIRDTVGEFAEFIPMCPEVEIGLGTPRESLRLVRHEKGESLLMAPKSHSDHSRRMARYARRKAKELEALDLCGCIVKKGSPSCGMERVRVYPEEGSAAPSRDGRGAFTRILMQEFPLLPIEEDGRLKDPHLRENFYERVFAYRRLKDLFASDWGRLDLLAFHANETLLLMAHSDDKTPGLLAARCQKMPPEALEGEYEREFLTALAPATSIEKHLNVLLHMVGQFAGALDSASRQELHGHIAAYQKKCVPLAVPVTLVRHHVRRLGLTYLQNQSYLSPYPQALRLRDQF